MVSSCEIARELSITLSGLELGRNFERELQECMNICLFNSK